jgi:hypothetical protein
MTGAPQMVPIHGEAFADLPSPSEAGGICLTVEVSAKPPSNIALEMRLPRIGQNQYTVHGFGSSIGDWVGEGTDFPRDVAGMALAHQVGSAVERAYLRGDSFARRPGVHEGLGCILRLLDPVRGLQRGLDPRSRP